MHSSHLRLHVTPLTSTDQIGLATNVMEASMQIKEALEKFTTQLEADGRSRHTVMQYLRHIRLLGRWMREDGLCDDVYAVTHEDVARFLVSPVAKLRPDGGIKKAVSMNALRSSLKGFFRYLHQAGYITENPTRLTKRAVCGTPPPRVLNDDEQTRLMNAMSKKIGFHAERDHLLFQLMLATGIRLSSALTLNIEDVDLDQGEVQIMMKGNRQEHVYLNNEIQSQLKLFIAEKASGPVFTSIHGHRLSQRHVQRRLSIWLKIAGINRPASVHSLRHTFATSLYQKTGDIFIVKQALNHRSITSTLIYAQMDNRRLRDAVSSSSSLV